MREIKLTGREIAVLRIVDFAVGTPGKELIERLNWSAEEVFDLVNGLVGVGFLEYIPEEKTPTLDDFPAVTVDVNPGFAHALREAMRRG